MQNGRGMWKEKCKTKGLIDFVELWTWGDGYRRVWVTGWVSRRTL